MRNHASASSQAEIVTIVYEPVRDRNGNFTNEAGAGHVAFFNQAAWEHLSRQQKRAVHKLLSAPPFDRPTKTLSSVFSPQPISPNRAILI